jgi:cell division protein FtsW (lipid II flippase)
MSKGVNTLWVRFPFGMVSYTLILAFVGVINIASAAKATRPNLFLMQLLWLLIGAGLVLIISLVQTRSLSFIAYPFYIGVILLLGALRTCQDQCGAGDSALLYRLSGVWWLPFTRPYTPI